MKHSFINKVVVVLILFCVPNFCMAASKKESNPVWAWMLENVILIIAGLVILGVIMALWQLMNSIMIQKSREFYKAHGIEVPEAPKASQETFLSRWFNKASGLIPLEQEADIVLDHNYDGIRELDNSLPPWWIYGFYLTIVIGIGYLYIYEYSDIGLTQHQEYELAMKEGEKQKAYFAAKQANNIDEENLVALTDEKSLEFGKSTYLNNCAACHGQLGEGGIGPNMTDDYWVHGGDLPSIYKTIKNGVPEKGMIAWKNQMQPAAIHKMASYIATLRGTNPPNQKAKEGVLYEEVQAATVK